MGTPGLIAFIAVAFVIVAIATALSPKNHGTGVLRTLDTVMWMHWRKHGPS
jgi:hypothetical protein